MGAKLLLFPGLSELPDWRDRARSWAAAGDGKRLTPLLGLLCLGAAALWGLVWQDSFAGAAAPGRPSLPGSAGRWARDAGCQQEGAAAAQVPASFCGDVPGCSEASAGAGLGLTRWS